MSYQMNPAIAAALLELPHMAGNDREVVELWQAGILLSRHQEKGISDADGETASAHERLDAIIQARWQELREKGAL